MGMQTNSGNGDSMPPMSEINVTPFVDVMLVLLIIFMVAAPHLEKGVDVELPAVDVAQDLTTKTDELEIKITKDKKVYLITTQGDNVETPLDNMTPIIKAALAGRSKKEIFVRADKSVPYGVVVKVMAAAKDAGASGLGMVTEEEVIKKP